eukprot:CAMPEP_0174912604 /NCGR_PEP_ID=MMETSP0167-20121228/79870_1 /TAXON_ID=38298 /ORGANISM="Rhodella maculata, Strain CCMP736" /LENGTH=685 /DNA_ID=CAMNT_0016157263 /DNA_START=155 /DNA_END=2213 /DNA_ORIENTATION=-
MTKAGRRKTVRAPGLPSRPSPTHTCGNTSSSGMSATSSSSSSPLSTTSTAKASFGLTAMESSAAAIPENSKGSAGLKSASGDSWDRHADVLVEDEVSPTFAGNELLGDECYFKQFELFYLYDIDPTASFGLAAMESSAAAIPEYSMGSAGLMSASGDSWDVHADVLVEDEFVDFFAAPTSAPPHCIQARLAPELSSAAHNVDHVAREAGFGSSDEGVDNAGASGARAMDTDGEAGTGRLEKGVDDVKSESIRDDALRAYIKTLDIKKLRRIKIMSFFFADSHGSRVANREPNRKRRYATVLRKMDAMSDAFFKRMFRVDRKSFRELMEITAKHFERSVRGAASAPQAVQLAAALRFFAGGIYLDICFGFNLHFTTVMTVVWRVAEAIDLELDNIYFPIDDEPKLKELEAGFNRISQGRFTGTVAAGDGVVFRIQRPRKDAVSGDVASFYTRKGYYAYGMQAFVDSRARFLNISMKMAASTHDSTSYIMSDLSKAIRDERLPDWAHIVLDEAYANRPQELSPYRGRNLDIWRDSFNYHLSLHRQCVERAFGILVARWGVFWRPLKVAFVRIPLLIRVCCRLHYFCVDRFGADKRSVAIARGDVQPRDSSSVLFIDGTGPSLGRRVDLEETSTEDQKRAELKEEGFLRPLHSPFSRVARIKLRMYCLDFLYNLVLMMNRIDLLISLT